MVNKKKIQDTKSIVNRYTSWTVYLKLLKAASCYWAFFIIGIIGTALAGGTDAILAWSVKPIMDNWSSIIGHKTWWLPLVILGILFIRGIAYFLSNYYLTSVGRNLVRDFRKRIFAHLMHFPISYYNKESSGKLLSVLIYNTEQVASASTEALLTVLQEGMSMIALIIVMFKNNWKLTIVFLATSPIISGIIRYTSKRLRKLSTNVQVTMGDLTHIAEEGIENYSVVRIFGGEDYEKNKFFSSANKNRQREMKVVATGAIGTSLTQIITAIPFAIIMFVVATNQFFKISIGEFSSFVVSVIMLLTPLRRLTKVNTEIQKGVAGAHSIFTLLDEKREHDIGTKTIERALGKIEYINVNFRYTGAKKNILHNINFKIEPLQNVALVGRSGGGKSTLINLLPRFYEVFGGKILIDGENIQEYKLADLRRQFSIVSQNLTLFNDTVANNIAYGALRDVSENKIMEAAEAAHILDFIKTLPNGLDTIIGDNGLLLSGGQRQRIAIARALLKDAPILILDEATSALDTESERYIQDSIGILMKKCTTIIIAHRLSTVEHVDKIIVLDRGSIIETGNHAELLALDGQYAKLYNMQFRGND